MTMRAPRQERALRPDCRPPDGPAGAAAPLDALLRRCGEELERLADRLAALEGHVGEIAVGETAAPGGGGLRAEAVRGLQDLDPMRQTAGALGAFLLRLSADAPACAFDAGAALAAVPLAGLAARLAGGAAETPAAMDEPELF
ncbi:hypothetical protein [Methylocella sp.]|uniref:hypothetical protein n=1 Tax=Methylocella sp. TaxID=1978226 RepID=UPI003784FB23